jgi:hypothetical protein
MVARRLTAPNTLEQMERTGKRSEIIPLLNGEACSRGDIQAGAHEKCCRLRLAWSNTGRSSRKRRRATASLDEGGRLRGPIRTIGFAAAATAGLSSIGGLVAAATGSAHRRRSRSHRLQRGQAAPAGRKRQYKSANQSQRLCQGFAHALIVRKMAENVK